MIIERPDGIISCSLELSKPFVLNLVNVWFGNMSPTLIVITALSIICFSLPVVMVSIIINNSFVEGKTICQV